MSNNQQVLEGEVTARAGSNIALIKYWGKRISASHPNLNLPATSSLSVTLDRLHTTTTLRIDPSLHADWVVLNGRTHDDARIARFLDDFRRRAGRPDAYCQVETENNFPTAAGLASSASGFAALTLAANEVFGLALDRQALSAIARQGSGSAARSLFGGFVALDRGEEEDGSDAVARPILGGSAWPLEIVVAVTDLKEKAVSSRTGMEHTMRSSPYYANWVKHNELRFVEAHRAVLTKDFEKLAALSEASALQMHASALAAEPGLIYWTPASVACMQLIRSLRQAGEGVFFTMDAGPQVKAVCLKDNVDTVAKALSEVTGVVRVLQTPLGAEARLL